MLIVKRQRFRDLKTDAKLLIKDTETDHHHSAIKSLLDSLQAYREELKQMIHHVAKQDTSLPSYQPD